MDAGMYPPYERRFASEWGRTMIRLSCGRCGRLMTRHFGVHESLGTGMKCRCGAEHRVNDDRLGAAIDAALAAGRRRLVLGVDVPSGI